MSSMNIHIRRIVLEGLSVSDHQQSVLNASLESELALLFAEGISSDELQSNADPARIPKSEIREVDETNPARLGRQIARAIYEGINR